MITSPRVRSSNGKQQVKAVATTPGRALMLWMIPYCAGSRTRSCTAWWIVVHRPGALARVRVVLSRSVIT